MKVKLTAQVFSDFVAAGMEEYMSFGQLRSEVIGTIKCIDRMNKLFDMFNSYATSSKKTCETISC